MVPQESIEAYQTAKTWKDFADIKGTSGIDGIQADMDENNISWYGIDGIRLPKAPERRGIYIRVTPKGSSKVVIDR